MKVESFNGRFLEDFKVGDIYRHAVGRTILEVDNMWFTCATMNTNQVYFNRHFASLTDYAKPPVNSCFLLALVNSLTVADTSKNGMVIGWENVRMPNPAYPEETIYAQSEVLSVRESKSQPGRGIVKFKTIAGTSEGKIVLTFERTIMVYSRATAPVNSVFPEVKA